MADTGFDELRDLASASGDKVSLAMGMAGWLAALVGHARFHEASELASELSSLLESWGRAGGRAGSSAAAASSTSHRCSGRERRLRA
jgi:adenylate cyclase